jgi:hypothetical protein
MAARAVADGFDAFKLAPFDELPLNLADTAEPAKLRNPGVPQLWGPAFVQST